MALIGRTISHFEVLRKVGEGGMGMVYLARDVKLDREVALKFLSPHSMSDDTDRARLVQEARAAASLQHSNICTVHEIGEAAGQTFIAMSYLPGQTLENLISTEPLPFAQAVDIALQISEGLQAAHAQGVIHRDIKPANIMVSDDSRATIMDFGLARMTDATRLTRTGTTMGTVRYMSPEQVKGESVDHRTDIWSLGVLLYEMTTGRHPFPGDNPAASMYSLLKAEPEAPSRLKPELPPELDTIVAKALAKQATHRYLKTTDLLDDLRALKTDPSTVSAVRGPRPTGARWRRPAVWAGLVSMLALSAFFGSSILDRASPGREIESIAILPLLNLSGLESHEVYADGLTMELISTLGRIGDGTFTVTGRRTVMQYKGSDRPLAEIARELDVDAIVEGSVQLVEDDLRITAELISADSGRILWTDVFDGDIGTVLSLQGKVSNAVAEAIGAELPGPSSIDLTSRPPVDPDAYLAYLQARLMGFFAREHYQRAVDLDSTFAEAWAGLSWEYSWEATWGFLSPDIALPQARSSALKALDLDPDLVMGHVALGYVQMTQDWDWHNAQRSFSRALEIDPNSVEARRTYATELVRADRCDEGLAMIQEAARLDPMNQYTQLVVGYLLLYSRMMDEAVTHFDTMLDLFPDGRTTTIMRMERGWALGYLGRHEEAAVIAAEGRGSDAGRWTLGGNWHTSRDMARSSFREQIQDHLGDALASHQDAPTWQTAWLMAFYHTALEQGGEARVWLAKADSTLGRDLAAEEPEVGNKIFRQARLCAWLGKKESALKWLSAAFDLRVPSVLLINSLPEFDSIREDEDFKSIVGEIWG